MAKVTLLKIRKPDGTEYEFPAIVGPRGPKGEGAPGYSVAGEMASLRETGLKTFGNLFDESITDLEPTDITTRGGWVKDHYVLTSTGTLEVSADYTHTKTSGLIPIDAAHGENGKIYLSMRLKTTDQRYRTRFIKVAFYDSNKSFISLPVNLTELQYGTDTGEVTIPSSAAYMRFSFTYNTQELTAFDKFLVSYSSAIIHNSYSKNIVFDNEIDNSVPSDLLLGKDLLELEFYDYCSTKQISLGSNPEVVTISNVNRRVYFMRCEPNADYYLSAPADHITYLGASSSFIIKNVNTNLTSAVRNTDASVPYECELHIKTVADSKCIVFEIYAPELANLAASETEYRDNYFDEIIRNIVISREPINTVPEGLYHDPDNTYTHAPYHTEGAKLAVEKAKVFTDIEWLPIKDMPKVSTNNDDVYPIGVTQKGLPYSSVKGYNKFIGNDVLLETFVTALKNPKGLIYDYRCTDEANRIKNYAVQSVAGGKLCSNSQTSYTLTGQANCGSYYGTVCSTMAGWPIGLVTPETTYSWMLPNTGMDLVPATPNDFKIGDTLIQSKATTGGGHTFVVLDIERNRQGDAKYVTLAQSNWSNCHVDRKTAEDIRRTYLIRSGKSSVITQGPGEAYVRTDAYRFNGLESNAISQFSMYGADNISSGSTTLDFYMDSRFDQVGCVFLNDVEVYNYTYDPSFNSRKLTITFPRTLTTSDVITVGRLDSDRTFIMPQDSYNDGNGRIIMDRGNKAVYSIGEPVKFSVIGNNNPTIVIRDFDTNAVVSGYTKSNEAFSESVVTVEGASSITLTGVVVTIDGLAANKYYKVELVESDTVVGYQEFLVYDVGDIMLTGGWSGDNVKGYLVPQTSYTGILEPYFVSRVDATGIVKETGYFRYVNNRYEFEVGPVESSSAIYSNYIKASFKCRYGRVSTKPFNILG